MDNIIEPNPLFDFSKISLVTPVSIQGGAYFTKILYKDAPLYIQTPKSLTRQGFVKNGKRYFCDLMFDNENEDFITWIENLENKCQKIVCEKSNSWFESTLEINDIESAFNPPLKLFKSGKYYLLRTHVKTNSLTNSPLIKIFNENETILTIDDVNTETNIVSIIEIQGIKFTTRNFQIEFELKQVMVMKTDFFFENCLIKKREQQKNIVEENKEIEEEKEEQVDNNKDEPLETLRNKTLDEILIETIHEEKIHEKEEEEKKTEMEENKESEIDLELDLEIEDLNKEEEKNNCKEFDFSLSNANHLETMNLKKPNEVYYEIYKQARRKAKDIKKQAVLAYLEARNIKKTYMLDDIENSDSEDESDFGEDFLSENDL
jgi:hypothetical protein